MKGAFTDAKADRVGRFELADGGTLFLDEIGEHARSASRRSCCACSQTGEFAPGGLVADAPRRRARRARATNADLHAEVPAGRFREDLLYRLNTVEVQLPPLRERREDIPPLAQHFLAAQAAALPASRRSGFGRGGARGAARAPLAGQRPRAGARGGARAC